jgi:ribosomal protein S1
MSDETTGAATTATAEPMVQAVTATPSNASTDHAATTLNGASAPAEPVDSMADFMQQMPPLDQIEVPGGESEPRRGGRGGRDRDNNDRSSGGLSETRPGTVVTGEVVKIDHEGVLVDVGTKSEGLIRPNELSREPVANISDLVSVGDKIDVLILEERPDGTLLLSKKRADFEKAWDRVQEALGTGQTLQAMVSDRVKGGLVVDLGIRGFVPASHVGNGKLKNLEKFVGQSVPLKVLEVDRNNRKVVLSHRLATEEEREKEKLTTIQSLAEGQTRTGAIRRVTDYGAFVDLGGIDGLLHVSEMSWTRIKHPSDIVKVGQEVQVMILKLNLEQGRVSLGMRQILPDPWDTVAEKYHVGDVIEGEVTRLVPFGAFVLLEGDIEGIIPNSELAHRRIAKPADVVESGQMVQIKVIDVRADERRLTLSLRALQPRDPAEDYRAAPRAGAPVAGEAPASDDAGRRGDKRERRRGRGGDEEGGGDYRQFLSRGDAGGGGGLTIGDMFGDLLSGRGAAAKTGGKGEKRRGRRVDEEDEDLTDIELEELDAEPVAEVDAEAATEETPEA